MGLDASLSSLKKLVGVAVAVPPLTYAGGLHVERLGSQLRLPAPRFVLEFDDRTDHDLRSLAVL